MSAKTSPTPRDDEQAIHALLDHFEDAFAKRDAKLYASNFADDGEWENAFGGKETGREAIEKRLAGVYTAFQHAEQTILDRHIRFVTDDVAVAVVTRDIHGQVSAETQAPLPPRQVRTTSVVRKRNEIWEVVLLQAADVRTDDLPSR